MKRLIVLLVIILLLNTTNLSNSQKLINNSEGIKNKTIYINDDNINGPWDGTINYPYKYIKDGVTNSTQGDEIYVFAGTYNETIVIDKMISLVGENKSSTVIDGNNNEIILNIIVDNIHIENFIIRNSNGNIQSAGIKINSNNNEIENCTIYRTKTGISLNNSNENLIDNCTFHTDGVGVLLISSNNNTITGCCFSHNSIGLEIVNSIYDKISFTYFHTNGIACLFNDSTKIQLNHCNVSDNQANMGGIFIFECSNVIVNNSIISHNGAGFHIYSSNMITIDKCDLFLNTHYTIILRSYSKDIVIKNSNIKDSFRYGFYIEKMNILKIYNCNILNNTQYAIYSKFSYIDAKNNWWGSILGPGLFRKANRIGTILNRIKVFPWLRKPISDIGANWKDNEPFMEKEIENYKRKINLPGLDSDFDGVPNSWEEKWGYDPFSWDDHENLDPDKDALNNIEECYTDEYGSNPFYKDIFLEIDWMKSTEPNVSNKPSIELTNKLVEIFENHSINLHIDIGNLGGGKEIPASSLKYSFGRLQDQYWNYFLCNDLTNPRKGIFHYGIICDVCPDLNFPFIGWDNLDSFAISAGWLKNIIPFVSRDRLIVGAIVHHLGHTLGLIGDTYGGIDNLGTESILSLQWWKYRNYESCMNYYWKYKILTYSDGTHGKGDFDDWGNLDFSFFKNSHFEWPKN